MQDAELVRVHPSFWKISMCDIANGYGIATVTLRSGVVLEGSVNKELSLGDVLHLECPGGWHSIDYWEIAAITGKVRAR